MRVKDIYDEGKGKPRGNKELWQEKLFFLLPNKTQNQTSLNTHTHTHARIWRTWMGSLG